MSLKNNKKKFLIFENGPRKARNSTYNQFLMQVQNRVFGIKDLWYYPWAFIGTGGRQPYHYTSRMIVSGAWTARIEPATINGKGVN